jgi:hypothetical protein
LRSGEAGITVIHDIASSCLPFEMLATPTKRPATETGINRRLAVPGTGWPTVRPAAEQRTARRRTHREPLTASALVAAIFRPRLSSYANEFLGIYCVRLRAAVLMTHVSTRLLRGHQRQVMYSHRRIRVGNSMGNYHDGLSQ